MKKFSYWLSVIVIGIALGFALQFVRAWTEPASSPPGGNLGAPINTGPVAQSKAAVIKANDFCLNSDPTKCLSTVSGGTTSDPNVGIGCDGGRYICGQTYESNPGCPGQYGGCGLYNTTYMCNCGVLPGCHIDCPFTMQSTVPCLCSGG